MQVSHRKYPYDRTELLATAYYMSSYKGICHATVAWHCTKHYVMRLLQFERYSTSQWLRLTLEPIWQWRSSRSRVLKAHYVETRLRSPTS